MNIDAFVVQGWSGIAFRHIPADSPFGVLDFRFAGRAHDNRWNRAGEPTLYLAGDPGVAVAEFGRHLRESRSARLGAETIVRRVYELEVRVDRLLDLRDPRVGAAVADAAGLTLDPFPTCFLDRDLARASAGFLRQKTSVQALLVASAAFMDSLDRWVMVLFLERLPSDPSAFLSVRRADCTLQFDWGEQSPTDDSSA